MLTRSTLLAVLILALAPYCGAQEKAKSKPAELRILKAYIGVWDANIEVWPMGPKAPSIKMKGIETNQAYGEYWVASDFVSKFMGQTMKVHSIIGYDLDQKKLVGTVIDYGPYKATLSGKYDSKSNTVVWTTTGKDLQGRPLVQQTSITAKDGERVLVMKVPVPGKKGEFRKFMQINFVKRKAKSKAKAR